MKALEILNNDNIFDERYLSENNRYLKDDIREAIRELEDLQSRSCENCKFGMTYHFDDEIECFKIEADTQGIYFSKDFCCNKWESIDEK